MDVQRLESIFSRFECEPADLIPVLQDLQKEFNYLPHDELLVVSKKLGVPLTQIYSVATFYNAFSLVPKGEHQIKVCLGTACHLKGGPRLVEALERELGIARGSTTDDMMFTLETVNCLGACALAPLVVVGEQYYPQSTHLKLNRVMKKLRKGEEAEEVVEKKVEVRRRPPLKLKRINSAADFDAFRKSVMADYDPKKPVIIVCYGTGCVANHSPKVGEALQAAIDAAGLDRKVIPDIKTTGCHGFCSRAPLVVIEPEGLFYQNVKPEDAEDIVKTTLIEGKPVDRLLATDHHTGEHIPHDKDIPFYKYQTRIVLKNIGKIDPTEIRDTITAGGYQSLVKVLTTMKPDDVIKTVTDSGLRGRGGGGFPTGRKWRICRDVPGDVKFIVCNGDEGDPGAYMDRSIMEGDPHRVLEGMIIGAYAIGANQAYIYVRAEYPLAIKHLEIAMDQARTLGFLGKNILGTGFNFDIKINRGGGAFVCGEETALIKSVQGFIGEPVPRPPYPAQAGLWGLPTVINNVETWASVPEIMEKGAKWFSSIGTEKSKGAKVFSLVGRVNHSGLVEVAMGTPLRSIIFDVGGGIQENKDFKAVQIGGPSGGCVTTEFLDLPVDYDSLQSVGSMMGSGGMIVMDTTSCMVDVARYFMGFCYEESCGACTPCREGTKQVFHILTEICEGRGEEWHLDMLDEVASSLQSASLCGLGQTAANPIISTMKYFRNEYEAHVRQKKCPACVCKALLKFSIDPETCTGCMLCARECPSGAITGKKKQLHVLDQELCIKCGMCYDSCKFDAVKVES